MKKIISIVISLLIAVTLPAIGFAEGASEIDAGIYLNGALINTYDAYGNEIKPILYNGNLYLPLPSIAEALDMSYSWDGTTMSAYLGAQPGEAEYMLDVCAPYQDDDVGYRSTKNGDFFPMAGNEYTNGATFGDDSWAMFNLNAQYSTMSFIIGHRDDCVMIDAVLQIYLDGSLVQEINVGCEDLPKEYVVPVKNALSMKLLGLANNGYNDNMIGVAEFKLIK